MTDQYVAPAFPLDERGREPFETLVRDRLPGADVDAWTLLTYTLGAGRRAEAFLSEVVRRHDLDGAQLSVLMVLWFQPPPHRLSPTALSRYIAQSPSGMTHTVKRLTAAGLVSRINLETDGRAKHVQLTEAGVEVVARCAKDLAAAAEALFQPDRRPLRDLASAQRQIVEVLTAHYYPRMD